MQRGKKNDTYVVTESGTEIMYERCEKTLALHLKETRTHTEMT